MVLPFGEQNKKIDGGLRSLSALLVLNCVMHVRNKCKILL